MSSGTFPLFQLVVSIPLLNTIWVSQGRFQAVTRTATLSLQKQEKIRVGKKQFMMTAWDLMDHEV